MGEQDCWFITLTEGRASDIAIRRDVWHSLLTQMGQRWPEVEAWTVAEFAPRRGVHLHAVVKGAPGLSVEWLERKVGLLSEGAGVDMRMVTDREGLAKYLTKQLSDASLVGAWPRSFRPVSTTRGWCAEWLSRSAWRKRS